MLFTYCIDGIGIPTKVINSILFVNFAHLTITQTRYIEHYNYIYRTLALFIIITILI